MIPQFLNAQTAAIAAALAVPALLVLYFLKLRRQTVPIGSTLLWKKAIQDLQVNSPFQRLRRNLLLLLQLLVLLALLLALARPVSEGTAVAGEKTVILIDRSASMNARDGEGGGTRLDEAKSRARALVGTMTRGQEAMVISFADDPQIVQPFTGDTGALRSAINSIAPSDRPTRLSRAYTLANANMQFDFDAARDGEDGSQLHAADVFLFSDGRVPPTDVADLSLRGRLHYERVGRSETHNLAIVAASARRNYERPTEVQVFARAGNFGPEPVEGRVRISVAEIPEEGAERELSFNTVTLQPLAVTVPPNRWTDSQWRELNPEAANEADRAMQGFRRADSVDVRLELGRSAVVRVELVDSGDALETDDVAWVVVPPPEPLSVLLVTEGNYFLELLVNTQPLDAPRTMRPAEYEQALPTDYGVIIFDNYSPQQLPPSGTFIFSGGMPPRETTNIRQVTNEQDLPLFFEESEILDWERDHPMLAGLNLNRLWVAEGRLLTVPLGGRLLIEGIKGPMAILERAGPRTHLVFSFDLMQSNWPRLRTFPYFAYQMFQYLAVGADVRVRESLQPGSLVTVPQANVDRAGATGRVQLIGPEGGRDVAIDSSGTLTLGPFERVGIYRTVPALPQFERIAVSLLDDTESNLLPNPTDPGNLSGMDAQAAGMSEEGTTTRNVEWWWWLVAAAAGVLLLEWVVYTQRVGA